MRLFCRENHWLIIQGRLILKTPTGRDQERSRKMIKTLEAQIRQQVSNEIMEMDLLSDRKSITKQGLDNALKTTQILCAQRALYGIKNA